MRNNISFVQQLFSLCVALSLVVFLSGCSTGSDGSSSSETDKDTSESPGDDVAGSDASTTNPEDPDASTDDPDTSTAGSDTSSGGTDTVTEDPVEPIGNPVNESVSIDHATAYGAIEKNLKDHINGVEDALTFLEDSESVRNFVDMLSDDDEEEGEEGEGADDKKKDDEVDIDFSGMRDDMVELVADKLMVESTSKVADDGLSISYAVKSDFFCDKEPEEEEESDEQKEDRLKDEAECAERLGKSPLQIDVTSDGPGRMNLSIKAGKDGAEAIKAQIHDDVISVSSELANLRGFVEVFVDPDDFSLPATMEGAFACEIREDSFLQYTVRCSITEAINAVPDEDQEPFSLKLNQADEPLRATIDGNALTITGALSADDTQVSMPWQFIVDMFYEDEGYSETKCEPNGSGGEDCWEEWIDPPEPPEVDEAFIVSVPSVHGALDYAKSDDTFRISDVSMGGATTTAKVDSDTIVSFELHPDADYTLGVAVRGDKQDDMRIEFSPEVDVQVTMKWEPVSSVLDDPPSFLMDETFGVRFKDSEQPTMEILRDDEEDTQIQVASGRLTLWSTEMTDDVVIEEGQCITSVDEDKLTEAEKDAQHDLFGGLLGSTCEP